MSSSAAAPRDGEAHQGQEPGHGHALSALVSDSSCLFIMGHRSPDNDCIGAAAGVFAIARKRGVPAHIIQEPGSPPSKVLTDRLMQLPEYKDCFLSSRRRCSSWTTALWWWWWTPTAPSRSSPRRCWSPATASRSSTTTAGRHLYRGCRPQLPRALRFLRLGAGHRAAPVYRRPHRPDAGGGEALLAGIVLDTKNFSMRTGGRTFEAAAFLRRAGADTAEVKKLFQNDLAGTIAKYSIIQNAKL